MPSGEQLRAYKEFDIPFSKYENPLPFPKSGETLSNQIFYGAVRRPKFIEEEQ
jgi:hypothetical protein